MNENQRRAILGSLLARFNELRDWDKPVRDRCKDLCVDAGCPELTSDLVGIVEAERELMRAYIGASEASAEPLHASSHAKAGPDVVAGSPPREPMSIPGYELLEEVGRGGMGVVYKARQPGVKRLVALKVLLAGEWASHSDLERFRSEAQVLRRLSHTHIVVVYEVGEYQRRPFFSLEFCQGGSLAARLRRESMTPAEAAALMEALARAVQAAHEADIIHRDLKPANVLFAADGTAKLTDFGLAKQLGEPGLTRTGEVLGTPSYMAPEQAHGKKDVGPAADIYALGAILYECLTGRPPFIGDAPLAILDQVRSQPPVPPSRLRPNLPVPLVKLCLKCLAKKPEERYASAAELAKDLKSFLDHGQSAFQPVGELETRWGRNIGKRVAAAMPLALVAGLGLFFAQSLIRLPSRSGGNFSHVEKGHRRVSPDDFGGKKSTAEGRQPISEEGQPAPDARADAERPVDLARAREVVQRFLVPALAWLRCEGGGVLEGVRKALARSSRLLVEPRKKEDRRILAAVARINSADDAIRAAAKEYQDRMRQWRACKGSILDMPSPGLAVGMVCIGSQKRAAGGSARSTPPATTVDLVGIESPERAVLVKYLGEDPSGRIRTDVSHLSDEARKEILAVLPVSVFPDPPEKAYIRSPNPAVFPSGDELMIHEEKIRTWPFE